MQHKKTTWYHIHIKGFMRLLVNMSETTTEHVRIGYLRAMKKLETKSSHCARVKHTRCRTAITAFWPVVSAFSFPPYQRQSVKQTKGKKTFSPILSTRKRLFSLSFPITVNFVNFNCLRVLLTLKLFFTYMHVYYVYFPMNQL